ncbi:MAG: [LysW]-aminoadipate kinase [Planctomycetota bacterium]
MNTEPIMVIKLGGGEGIDAGPTVRAIAHRVARGERIVLVHGGSHETNELSRTLGRPPQFITSPSGHTSRRTDRPTLEVFLMAYCGLVNKSIVEELRRLGVDAVGLSGIDAGIWRGERKGAIRSVEDGRVTLVRDDLSGRVTGVDGAFLSSLLDRGLTPVLTPPAITDDGVAINVDADRAAAATASALDADRLLLLSNVPGVLKDVHDPTSLITSAGPEDERVRNAAHGRMKNKVLAAEEALAGGVRTVVIGPASGEDPVGAALDGAGTRFEGVPA